MDRESVQCPDSFARHSRRERDYNALAERMSHAEKQLKESEDQRYQLKSELSAMQDMVNSSTYHRERISELEKQLAETKQRAEDDRRSLREQVSLKEGAILRQVSLPFLNIKDHVLLPCSLRKDSRASSSRTHACTCVFPHSSRTRACLHAFVHFERFSVPVHSLRAVAPVCALVHFLLRLFV